MPKYELMYLLGANVAETDVPVVSAQVLKAAQDNGGTQIQETQLGKKKLAYPIKKTRNGFYVVVNFEMDSGKISRLDAKIRGMDSSIVRYLIVNTEEHLARLAKDKAEQAKIKRRIPPPVKLENKSKAEGAKIPAIKLEDIDEKMLDEKIEKALSEDVTK